MATVTLELTPEVLSSLRLDPDRYTTASDQLATKALAGE